MRRPSVRAALAVGLVLLVVAGGLVALVTKLDGGGSGGRGLPPRGSDYLALGDSLAFGYQPSDERPAPDYDVASHFVGYPEDLARTLHLHLVNAACPGETVASMISATAASNGCENTDGKGGGYRTIYPLHTRYAGSQLDFAVRYLESHRDTRLVTIDIGINDVDVCGQITADKCSSASELSALRTEIDSGLQLIYADLRDEAGYHGSLVALSYYQTSDGDAGVSRALDAVIAKATDMAHGIVADGYDAFRRASAASGGSACRAGLLIALPGGGCDEHANRRGQDDLAAAVVSALRR